VRRHLCSILALCSLSQLITFSGLRGVTLPASAVRALDVRRWASEVVKRGGCSDCVRILQIMANEVSGFYIYTAEPRAGGSSPLSR
jgi:hypothetical protein